MIAIPEPAHWSSEAPTVPGVYWLWEPDFPASRDGTAEIVSLEEVAGRDGEFYVQRPGLEAGYETASSLSGARWRGPLLP